MMRILIVSLLLICVHFTSIAQTVIPLYDGRIPNSKETPSTYVENINASGFITKVSVPTLKLFLPPKEIAVGTAVIIAPSGGYEVWVDEGDAVARAFNKIGVTAFVLKYRLPSDEIMFDRSTGPLQDAQMAISLVRHRAAEWNIDPAKIGLVGISAGGHIASTAGTHFQTSLVKSSSNISVRPDFLVLLYPVISMDLSQVSKTQTRKNLLGESPTTERIDFFSSEKNVTPETPPVWLIHAGDDSRITVKHSLLFYDALLTAGVKAEMHILPTGGHGFALEHETRRDKWMEWCSDWLSETGFLK